jgi:hypothetical protein
MRKLGVFLLVLGLVVAFAIPAFAWQQEDGKGGKFYLGGTWMTDFGWWDKSKERSGTNSEQTQFMMNIPAHTNFRGFVEVGGAGGFFELGVGTGAGQVTGVESSNVTIRKMYGYYNFGNCQFLAGKTDGWIWSLVPQQRLGANLLTVWDFGFGNFYDGRFSQLRFTQNINKQFSYAISLVANQAATDTLVPAGNKTVTATDGSAVTVPFTAAKTSGSYAQFPVVAGKLTMNFGVVSLYPAAAWSRIKWDNLPGGWDGDLDSWYAVLPVKVVAGPFTGLFQFGYGQNFTTLLNPGNANSFQTYKRTASGLIKNTTGMNGFFDLGWTIGPVTPHFYAGFDQADNSDIYKNGDSYNRRYSIGGAVNYNVTANFMISPEFTWFDFGKTPGIANAPDIGKDWMAGIQFVFAF